MSGFGEGKARSFRPLLLPLFDSGEVKLVIQGMLIRVPVFVVRRLPQRVVDGLTVLIGDITYALWARGRDNVIRNMTVLLGDEGDPKEARRLARKSFRHYLRVMGDFIRLPQLDSEELERNLIFSGWERLDEALADGKGAILVGAHIGHWDLSGLIVAMRGYPMSAIVERFEWPEIDKLVQSSRARWGMKPIPVDRALRLVYKALRANEAVGILTDRPSFDNGVPVTLFGKETRWPSGPATLAIRTGAKILVGYIIRRPDGRFEGELQLVDGAEITGHMEHDVRVLTQEIASMLEEAIRACPQQWCMFRQMWPEAS